MNSNICILGTNNSGKTTFVNKILGHKTDYLTPTIGVEFSSKLVWYKHKQLRWQIWDCGGYDNHLHFLLNYIIRSHIFLLFLDMSIPISRQVIDKYIDTIYENHTNPKIILICSKSDKQRMISDFDIKYLTEKYNIEKIKISMKDDSIYHVINKINDYLFDKEITFENEIKKSLLQKENNKKNRINYFCCLF